MRTSRAILLAVFRRPRSLVTGVSLACVLLVALAGAPGAFASTTDELRGEWKFELNCGCTFPTGSNTLEITALISKMDQETGEFSGTTSFDGYPGEFTENLTSKEKPHVTGNKAAFVLESETPDGVFFMVVNEGNVLDGGSEMFGAGIYDAGTPYEEQGTFVAKQIRSWAEIEKEEKEKKEKAEKERIEREGREKGEREGRAKGEQEGLAKGEQEGKAKAEQEVKLKAEQEATERTAKEAQAKTEREAREKTEKEAAEKAEAQTREKIEKEVREKLEKEAKELAAKEAKQKAEKQAKERLRSGGGQTAVLVGKSFTVAASGQLSLQLTNANGYSISGVLTLDPATATKAGAGAGGTSGGAPSKGKSTAGKGSSTTGKAKPVVLAEAAYTIASHSSKTVQLKLSKSALTELEHHKTLQLVASVTTRAAGKPSSTKTYEITLKLASAKG
ncbi:MAG TPA: hypothetical protein VG147_06310 [Solirubrobacteraceae bacterium]|jgi:hypothetical protein|nr:hypothetical protein [Solirubrobacteraceae bacterium]